MQIFPEPRVRDGDALRVRHCDSIPGNRGQDSKGHRDPVISPRIDRPGQLSMRSMHAQSVRQLVGQVVIVVRADQTPQQAVLDAIETLSDGKAVSLVLNQSLEQPRPGYYYQYQQLGGGARPLERARDS